MSETEPNILATAGEKITLPRLEQLRLERGDGFNVLDALSENIAFESVFVYMDKHFKLKMVDAEPGQPRVLKFREYLESQTAASSQDYISEGISFTADELYGAIQSKIESGHLRIHKKGERNRFDDEFTDLKDVESAIRARFVERIFAQDSFDGIESAPDIETFEWFVDNIANTDYLDCVFKAPHRLPDPHLNKHKPKKLDTEIVTAALLFAERQYDPDTVHQAAEIISKKLLKLKSYRVIVDEHSASKHGELKIVSEDLKGPRKKLKGIIDSQLLHRLPALGTAEIKTAHQRGNFQSLFACLVYKDIHDYRDPKPKIHGKKTQYILSTPEDIKASKDNKPEREEVIKRGLDLIDRHRPLEENSLLSGDDEPISLELKSEILDLLEAIKNEINHNQLVNDIHGVLHSSQINKNLSPRVFTKIANSDRIMEELHAALPDYNIDLLPLEPGGPTKNLPLALDRIFFTVIYSLETAPAAKSLYRLKANNLSIASYAYQDQRLISDEAAFTIHFGKTAMGKKRRKHLLSRVDEGDADFEIYKKYLTGTSKPKT